MDTTAGTPLSGKPDRLTEAPGSVIVDGQSYEDSWESLARASVPEDAVWTAEVRSDPPTVDAYAQAMTEAVEEGYAVLCLTPAQTLSRSFAQAQAAASVVEKWHPQHTVRVVDTGLVGGGVGLVAHAALEVSEGELSVGLERVTQLIRRCHLYSYVEDVAPLAATGKVPRQVGAWLQEGTRRRSLLSLSRGELSFLAAIPSWHRGGERMLKLVRAQSRLSAAALVVQWSDGEERAQELTEALYQGVNCSPLFAARACPSLSAIAGRGAVAVAFYTWD